MTKLKGQAAMSKIRPELNRLIHDKIISICQKRYASFEVDGIICITLLDTKEQQVVKIHKTLKAVNAVNADTAKSIPLSKAKHKVYPSIAAILSSNGTGDVRSPGNVPGGQTTYQNDINRLSDILKETNGVESYEALHDDYQSVRKGKRKRRNPVQVTDKVVNDNPSETAVTDIAGYDKYSDSMIIVKEEPIDNEYDPASVAPISDSPSIENDEHNTGLKIGAIGSITDSSKQFPEIKTCDESDANDPKIADTDTPEPYPVPVSSYINSVIDERLGLDGQEATKTDSLPHNLGNYNDDSLKSEGSSKKHSEWLYNLAQRSLIEGGNNSGSDSGSSDSLKKASERNSYLQRERGRQEPDPLGRSWFEMIKSNASRYQAALMRSGVKGKTCDDIPKPSTNTNFDYLRELLRDKRAQSENSDSREKLDSNKEAIENGSIESEEIAVEPPNDRLKSRSISPVPVVKIEVDELGPGYDNHTSTMEDTVPVSTPKPQGKLESRYPALFNQLQQSKRDATPVMDQPDSLVNRLPFISFQEIFSQSSSNTKSETSKAVSETQANPEKSKLQADQAEENGTKKSKTVWNWKKRQVKPKDKDSIIIDQLLNGSPLPTSNVTSKPLGINMSAKKTLLKKRNKPDDEDDDTDWTPSSDKKLKPSVTDSPRSRLSTRLSAGERPRIDFAEIDDLSDPEEIVEEEAVIKEEPSEMGEDIELISAFCRYQCGLRFETFGDLAEHEDICELKASSSSDNVDGGETDQTEHKCEICGLDFNQEYRWQYHMVKVHGVSVNTDRTLFR